MKIRPLRILALLFIFFLFLEVSLFPSTSAYVQCCPTWTGAVFKGYDNFYGSSVTAFKTGQSATVNFLVRNDNYNSSVISAAKIRMDWGQNYTASDTPVTLRPSETHLFTITFNVPAASTASNLVAYSFTIIVEHNQGPVTIFFGYERFAIYSSDQADAQALRLRYQTLTQSVGTLGFLPYPLSDSKTRTLIIRAQVEAQTGDQNYLSGNFTASRQRYQSAVDLANQALDSMQAQGSGFESAVNNYLNFGRIGPILNGIGWLIIGIGVVWYAKRSSSKAAVPSAAAGTGPASQPS